MKYMIYFLFPIQAAFGLCESCQLKMEERDVYSIAYKAIYDAKIKGLHRPPYIISFPFTDWVAEYLRNPENYSIYRMKFDYLSRWAEEDVAEAISNLKNQIQEIEEKLAYYRSWEEPDLDGIKYYEFILEQRNSALKGWTKELPEIQSELSQGLNELTQSCERLYTLCIEEHNDQNSFYERSLVYFDQGNFLESINDISKFLDTDQKIPTQTSPSDIYLAQGICYSDLALYNQAIEALSEAIRTNPENRAAYLERAGVYFETGDFESSIQDFLASGYNTTPINSSLLDYAGGFIKGASNGFSEAVIQFVPALLNSAQGLSNAIWSLAIHPKQFSEEVFNICAEFTKFLANHSTPEVVGAISPKLRALVFDPDSLSLQEKGEYLGYLISKNGVELFAISGAMKAYREIRRANMIMTLETLVASKPKVIEKSVGWGERHADAIKKMRTEEIFVKSLRKQSLPESTVRKTLHELGYKTFPRPKGVPENFKVNFSQKNFGMEYVDPKNRHNSVRVMPGDPHSPNLRQQKPYVVHKKNGQLLDKNGKILKEEEIELSHISIEEFFFRE